MQSLTFSIDELNTLLHPSEKQRELKGQELTDCDRLARHILADWTKTRLTLWMTTSTEFEIYRTADAPQELLANLDRLNVLPYIHRTCFSGHKNISLTTTLERESYVTDENKLRHRKVLIITINITR